DNRGVILYGNATTNSAYPDLLQGCPVVLQRNELRIGATTYKGEALGTYFMWPRPGTTHAAVAVIGGTGIAGMRAADANQYFAGGSGFPDFMVFTADMLMQGEIALKVAGFYNHKWELGTDWLAQ
ncbi:MAG TPA: alpha/beta hydrolase, partial [Phnomibacter sp.]|nr:alpha/beta hydrolase [Phnomibacter sp.]